MSSGFSRRELIIYFASFVARLLNRSSAGTELEDYSLYLGISDALSRPRTRCPEGFPFALTGHHLVRDRLSAEEAAHIYFERVLSRPLFLARDLHYHKGHELLHTLCKRSAARNWAGAELKRTAQLDTARGASDEEASRLAMALSTCPRQCSDGNPAAKTRQMSGPLYLQLTMNGTAVELPEELCLWDAIRAAPRRLSAVEGQDWLDFKNLVIRAFEAANTPYGALLGLGLWPPDWEESLSTHQVKQLSAFLAEAKEVSAEHSKQSWQKVWETSRQVPGFKTADDLWNSELGAALRDASRARIVSYEDAGVENFADTRQTEDAFDVSTFDRMVKLCLEGGCIDEVEMFILVELARGTSAADLQADKRIRSLLGRHRVSFAVYLDTLSNRVRSFVANQGSNPSR